MSGFIENWRKTWLWMLEPPWKHPGNDGKRDGHWATWLLGWAWTLAGLAGGAIVAPTLVQAMGLAGSSYQDWLVIGIAVLAGFLVQVIGWAVLVVIAVPIVVVENLRPTSDNNRPILLDLLILVGAVVAFLFPLAGVSYGIYRYINWVGADQSTVTIAFVGGLLVKTFLIPLIKGIVTGALFRWLMKWLRGGKDTKKAG